MLCTRMHLAERRYSLPREPAEGVPRTPSGIIQRPCVIRNLSGNYDSIVTPRIMDPSKKFDTKKKPPLVVFSLKMQPGIKTLAQDNVKRDPRKLPTFCEQYKLTKRVRAADKRPHCDLIVRGVEMLGDPSGSDVKSEGNAEYIPKELQVQLTDCCQCMRDFNFFQSELEHRQPETEEIQRHEHSTLPAKPELFNDLKIHKPLTFGQKLVTTPRTRQIIKITMNARKS